MKIHDLTKDHVARRVVVVNHDDRFHCTVEERVGGGYVLIWDVTNLPLGTRNGDRFEWLD